MSRIDFIFDFETRSRVDLKRSGASKYALDPSSEATLLTYTFGEHMEIKHWRLGQPFPMDLINVANNPERFNFAAWNLFFDKKIWEIVLPRQFPLIVFKPIPLPSIDDVMARSNFFRTGSSLESAAKFHHLPMGKDPVGKKIMQKQMKPGRDGKFAVLTEDEWNHFIRYGIQDTFLLKKVHYSLPPLPLQERYAFEWTWRRNEAGLKLDMELVVLLQQLVDYISPSLREEFFKITGHVIASPKLISWFGTYYPGITSLDAENMDELIDDPRPVPPYVRRALEIKYLIGSSSISKLKVAIEREVNGRIHSILSYHKAQTKRWAGEGIQVQNFPRMEQDPADPFDFDLNQHSLVQEILKQAHTKGLREPIKFARNLLRRIFVAEHGKLLAAGDFAKIEPTVLFWLTGLGPIPDKWYEETAAFIFNVSLDQISGDSDERQLGKQANLSCGYGSGWDSFRKATKKATGKWISEELAKMAVNGYRKKYPEIVGFWADLDNAFRAAIMGQQTLLCNGKVHFYPSQYAGHRMVVIRLPSGGCLFYHNPQIIESVKVDKLGRKRVTSAIVYDSDAGQGRIEEKKIYGGLICENVVSAIAREVMNHAMFRLEEKGYEILNLVHDEIWVLLNSMDQKTEFEALMIQRPGWALDMVIKAEVKAGVRYIK